MGENLRPDGGPSSHSNQRPSPEAPLREERRSGRLKIFVGAAPGVGKTYQMLQQARARKQDGYDAVVGVVETHGRKEMQALLDGLEIIPRKRVEYRGQWLEEMDFDALIARNPQIALVDELAHTNVPGSRHPKRYLDIEELLNHGIDVYTTLNIQHIESLNDIVAQISRVRVRETVPDSVFDRADAVELVDLIPDDLIERLKEGKVYIPQQAVRALEHYFSPGNLMVLRNLALRRTAERVDDQLLTHMGAHATSDEGVEQKHWTFVSFASADRKAAMEILRELEYANIRCWISSRDVPYGKDYQTAIVDALDNADSMLLVFSNNANESEEIARETALASKQKILILPVRIEGTDPRGALRYQLATRQYIDLYENRNQKMKSMIQALQTIRQGN
jgi:hypothetical protein